MRLSGKKIILGITGGIAAYKSILLLRLLKSEGADVQVILSETAKDFVTPLTLGTLSQNPVLSNFISSKEEGVWNNHVELGLWADLMIIAPLTANSLAKMANGSCDNFLSAVYLSAKCKVLLAPAMDLDMYMHPTTQNNLQKVKGFGNIVLPADEGFLASGLHGVGRMQAPENILNSVLDFFYKSNGLEGKKVLISMGGTREAIDPVRFIGNRSSGKMGLELTKTCLERGAIVTVVAGTLNVNLPLHPNLKVIYIESALQMQIALEAEIESNHILVMAAAVADYRIKEVAKEKIKKTNKQMQLELVKNPDILKSLASKKNNKIFVGFALETENEVENAKEKVKSKNLNFLILNSLKQKGAGFEHDTNQIKIIDDNLKLKEFNLKSKQEVAEDIVDYLENYIKNA